MCTQTQTIDATGQFAERLVELVNGGALSLMISVGHRTGLFDTMAQLPPSTTSQIADAAGLQERYVREWLGAMATGKIVDYDSSEGTYSLPSEHAAFLTRAATPNNLATVTQWISVLGSVEDKIVECFRNGGGVPYTEYKRFHAVMAEESGQTTVAALEEHILPTVIGLREQLEAGIEVLDIGCGSGRALIHLAELFPQSRFTGYDLCDEAISAAKAEVSWKKLRNIEFKVQDVSAVLDCNRFDLITAFDAIHDQAKPDVVLDNIHRALRQNGVFLMQDIKASSHVHQNHDHPLAPMIYTISCMHCMTVSLAQGGMGLGAAWGKEKALEMLEEAGFKTVRVEELAHDIQNYYYVVQK